MILEKTSKLKQSIYYNFGIVTALPKEFSAMCAMLDNGNNLPPIQDDPNQYYAGTIPAQDGSGLHRIVVTLLVKPGNNSATEAAAQLLRSFPEIQEVFMVGIAGGIPSPKNIDKHVRLGDIVISNEYGLIVRSFFIVIL